MDGAYLLGVIVGSLIMGAIVGAIPAILGLVKKQTMLGIVGFIACVVGNFILGLLLSLPICIGFTIAIFVKAKNNQNNQNYQNSQNNQNYQYNQINNGYTQTGNIPSQAVAKELCRKCGAEIDSNSKFCGECGEPK